MSLEFLQKLERAQLPIRVFDGEALRCIEDLLAAKLIEGGLGTSVADRREMAIVRRITPLGRAHLALARRSHWDTLDSGGPVPEPDDPSL